MILFDLQYNQLKQAPNFEAKLFRKYPSLTPIQPFGDSKNFSQLKFSKLKLWGLDLVNKTEDLETLKSESEYSVFVIQKG